MQDVKLTDPVNANVITPVNVASTVQPSVDVKGPTTDVITGSLVTPKKTFKEKSWSERLGYNWYHDGQFVHSWFIQDPRIVFAIRLLLACWLVGIYIAAWVTSSAPSYFLTYFTNLSYTGLMCSEIVLAYLSFMRMTKGPKTAEQKATPYHPWTFSPNNKFFRGLIYTVVPPQVSIHLVVVVVYWGLLAKGFQFLSFAEHGLEFVVACIEFFLLASYQITFVSALFQLACGILFMFYAWTLNATVPPIGSTASDPQNGYWVYGFLDWSNPMNALYYVLIIVLFVIALSIMYGFGILRDRGGRKTLAKKGIDLDQLERELNGKTDAVELEMAKV